MVVRRSDAILVFALGLLVIALRTSARADSLYVSDNSRIAKLTAGGEASTFANVNRAKGVAFDDSGNLWAIEQPVTGGNTSIHKITPAGLDSFVVAAGTAGGYGVAFDQDGNLYATLPGGITKVTPTGASSVFNPSREDGGLAFDSAGNLYASNYTNNRIDRFTPERRKFDLCEHRTESSRRPCHRSRWKCVCCQLRWSHRRKVYPCGCRFDLRKCGWISGASRIGVRQRRAPSTQRTGDHGAQSKRSRRTAQGRSSAIHWMSPHTSRFRQFRNRHQPVCCSAARFFVG